MIIRKEQASDIDAIDEITIAAFANHPYSQNTEQFIVKALRKAKALTVSLVAELDGQVVGHVAFSPATIDGQSCGWYGVGPVSVRPDHQKQGIGQALINEGLRILKASGAKGCALVGDPNYYQRFGFKNFSDLILEGVPPEFFMALPFGNGQPRGVMVFHKGFEAKPE